MQKRASFLARPGQPFSYRIWLGVTLAFGLWLTGLPSDLEVKCSADIRANVLVAELPKGPVGTSAEFSARSDGQATDRAPRTVRKNQN